VVFKYILEKNIYLYKLTLINGQFKSITVDKIILIIVQHFSYQNDSHFDMKNSCAILYFLNAHLLRLTFY
jgi:hypothetical protein